MQFLQHIISSKFLTGTHFPDDVPDYILDIIADEFSLPHAEYLQQYRLHFDGLCQDHEYRKNIDILRLLYNASREHLMFLALELRDQRMIDNLLESIDNYRYLGAAVASAATRFGDAGILASIPAKVPQNVTDMLAEERTSSRSSTIKGQSHGCMKRHCLGMLRRRHRLERVNT
jgi:hypothetical protein